MERSRNEEIARLIESCGLTTYLPQRDGGVFSEMISSGKDVEDIRKDIFGDDITALKDSDIIVCLLDGRALDEGMCIELGMAYALGKICIGYCTDSRSLSPKEMNIILEGTLRTVFATKKELQEYFESIVFSKN